MQRKPLNFKRGKKGSIEDLFLVVVLIFGFAFVLLISHNIINSITPKLTPQLNQSSPAAADIMNNANDKVGGVMDNLFFFLFMGLVIVLFILGYFSKFHPIFMVLFVIVLAIMIFLAVIFSNSFGNIRDTSSLNSSISSFTKTNLIMDNLPLIIGAIGMILMIVLYAKYSGGGGEVG